MSKRKPGLTYEQHVKFSDFINEMEIATRPIHKMIIETFGWSSPLGRRCEKMVLTQFKTPSFTKLRMVMEANFYDLDHLRNTNPYFDNRVPKFDQRIHVKPPLTHKLRQEQHEEIGPILRKWRHRTTSMIVLLKNSYPYTNRAGKTLIKIENHFDYIRDILDDHFYRDYPREVGSRAVEAYY